MKVKICGLRTLEAAQTAERAGADFLGFILWPKSRRYVSASQAGSIVQAVRERAMTVGVVVDQSLEEVVDLARRCRFNAIQLHGHEPPEYAEALRTKADVRIIKAFRWREAAEATLKLKKPLFLAGGISEANAKEAAQTLSPFALDVSGSLEEDGEKSPEKIRAFMNAVQDIRNEAAT